MVCIYGGTCTSEKHAWILCEILFRPPPGGAMAQRSCIFKIFFTSCFIRSYQKPLSIHSFSSSNGGMNPNCENTQHRVIYLYQESLLLIYRPSVLFVVSCISAWAGLVCICSPPNWIHNPDSNWSLLPTGTEGVHGTIVQYDRNGCWMH